MPIPSHSRYFLEPDALDKDGKLNREKQKAVNKIGHGKIKYSGRVSRG